ncbi:MULTISPECIES: N-ATPase subunit AtpR [Paraburkholderia]|uniref:F1F0 ATPase subunit 2 n=2 Tax=Paraburkholderia TaxID=1822464 RepID=A0A7Z0B4D6_9BURK|nr:ATP synthase subunit I [Paraburkholderia bryophila]NYH19938.1 F1F0 ATPase subunit 2 [Paraburkholderia bryophila]
MTNSLPSIAAQLAMGLALGTLAGAWHFMSLRWNWPLFAQGRAATALVLQLSRFAVTGALLLLLAHAGALALLAGMAGILLARTIAVRRAGAVS